MLGGYDAWCLEMMCCYYFQCKIDVLLPLDYILLRTSFKIMIKSSFLGFMLGKQTNIYQEYWIILPIATSNNAIYYKKFLQLIQNTEALKLEIKF